MVEDQRQRCAEFVGRIARFAWADDFAAARNFADSLLNTVWKAWADADDEIWGALELRTIVGRVSPDIAALKAGYSYARNGTGQSISYLKPCRVVRAAAGTWRGRVHGTLEVTGRSVQIPPDKVEWVHRRDFTVDSTGSLERNLALLHGWLRDEPQNPQVLFRLGDSYLATRRFEEALEYYGASSRSSLDGVPSAPGSIARSHVRCLRSAVPRTRRNSGSRLWLLSLPGLSRTSRWPKRSSNSANRCLRSSGHSGP